MDEKQQLMLYFWGKDVVDMSAMQINTLFREHDESYKWPILSRFNVTEQAIHALRELCQNGVHIPDGGIEYAMALDAEISRIVNNQI